MHSCYIYTYIWLVVYVFITACFTVLQNYEPQDFTNYKSTKIFINFVSRIYMCNYMNKCFTNIDACSFTRRSLERRQMLRIKLAVCHFFFNQRSGGKSLLCFPLLGCVCELCRRRSCIVCNQHVSLLFCM